MTIRLIDVNIHVGKPLQPASGEWFDSPEALIGQMDYYGIETALLSHYESKQCHPEKGNESLLRFTKSTPRLLPTWTFITSTGRSSDAPKVIDAALKAGARLLRYYPNEYFTTFTESAIGDYLEIVEARRIPLLVDFSTGSGYGQFQTDWENLIAVCRHHKDLPIITNEFRIRSNRPLFRALALCDNLRVCTSAVWLYRNIEHIVKEFGADRLVFGIGLPAFEPSIPVSMLKYADIPDAARIAIGAGNIEKLLGEIRFT